MALPWCLQSDHDSGGDEDRCQERLACKSSSLVAPLMSRLIQSPVARSQLLLCELLLAPFCSQMEDALCQSLTVLGSEHANYTRAQLGHARDLWGDGRDSAPGKVEKGKGVRDLVPVGCTNFPTGYLKHKGCQLASTGPRA